MKVFDVIERFIYGLCAGAITFAVLYPYAYMERGYHAVGGEGMAAIAAFMYVVWKWEVK